MGGRQESGNGQNMEGGDEVPYPRELGNILWVLKEAVLNTPQALLGRAIDSRQDGFPAIFQQDDTTDFVFGSTRILRIMSKYHVTEIFDARVCALAHIYYVQ